MVFNQDPESIVSQLGLCNIDDENIPQTLADIAAAYPSFDDQFRFINSYSHSDVWKPSSPKAIKTVAAFYYRCGNGGAERVITQLAGLYEEMGIRSIIITEQDIDENSYAIPEGVECVTIPEIHDPRSEDEYAARLAALQDIFTTHQVDALVYHAWLNQPLLWDFLLCKTMQVRFVLTVHGVFSFPFYLTTETHNAFATLPLIARYCDAVVSPLEMNRKFYSGFAPHAFTIPNPIPLELTDDAERFGPESRKQSDTVLWVGRLDALKRPQDALYIFEKVLDKRPKATLIMVGGGDSEQEEVNLLNLAIELGIKDRVRFEGYQKDVAHYYREANVLLSTTEVEGFCMVLLECSAMGLPAVMYDLPYLPFSSSEGVRSVPVGDRASAAEEVVRILQSRETQESMSEGALSCFEQFQSYDYKRAWNAVFTASSDARPKANDDISVWKTLLAHYIQGYRMANEDRSKAVEQQRRLDSDIREKEIVDSQTALKEEFEESTSWRIGRAVTALPRKLGHRE